MGRTDKTYLKPFCLLLALAVITTFASQSKAKLVLSTRDSAYFGQLKVYDGDLVEYDTVSGVSSIIFKEKMFGSNIDIDAIDILGSGNLVMSFNSTVNINGVKFNKADLIEYDPAANTASLFFSGSLFDKTEDIDAADVLSDGSIIISTTSDAILGGLKFSKDDLVRYVPATNTASIFFDGSLLKKNSNIDAFSMIDDHRILLSTSGSSSLGGLKFKDGDIVEYDLLSAAVSLHFGEKTMMTSSNIDIDAVYHPGAVPEPATALMLGLGGLIFLRKQKN